MSVGRLQLDFQRRAGPSRVAGFALLAAGLLAAGSIAYLYQRTAGEIEGIELQLAELRGEGPATTGDEDGSPSVAAARATVAGLATPWSQLLDDLEAASGDSQGAVALLEVEPDRERGKIRVLAEARSLGAALGYVERLQNAGTLVNPLLESHEVRSDITERPVRIQIAADWRVAS